MSGNIVCSNTSQSPSPQFGGVLPSSMQSSSDVSTMLQHGNTYLSSIQESSRNDGVHPHSSLWQSSSLSLAPFTLYDIANINLQQQQLERKYIENSKAQASTCEERFVHSAPHVGDNMLVSCVLDEALNLYDHVSQ
jgi:hypothetical protein